MIILVVGKLWHELIGNLQEAALVWGLKQAPGEVLC